MDALIPYGLMAGFGLVFCVVPVLSLATLLWAGFAEGVNDFAIHLAIFISFVFWVPVVCALTFVIPGISLFPWWPLFLEACLLFWCTPHAILLCRAKRESNRQKIWISLLGLLTLLSAIIGIGMIFLFGALSD